MSLTAATRPPDPLNDPGASVPPLRHPPASFQRTDLLVSAAISFGAVFVASICRWALEPLVGSMFPFLTFYVAVALVTWRAGRIAGILTLALSAASVLYFFLEPRFSSAVYGPGTAEGTSRGMSVYLLWGIALVILFDTRRRAWLEAATQAEILQVTLSHIGDGVITTDHAGHVTHMNALASHLTGWKCDEAVGQPIGKVMSLADPESRQRIDTHPHVSDFPIMLLRPDGGAHWIESTTATLPAKFGPGGHVIAFRNVTARRHAELEAGISLKKAQLVADAVPSLISDISKDFRYQLTNRTYEVWFERPRWEIHGRTMEEVLGTPAWEALRHHVMKALAGEHVTYESEIPYPGNRGSRWISASYTPDIADDGTVRGIVAHVIDITGQKHTEHVLRKNEEHLREADRRKDEFLAILAHELRNPLAPVRNALELLNVAGSDSDLATMARATMSRHVDHMVRLIDDLLDVSRINTGHLVLRRERTDLRQAVRDAVDASRDFIDLQQLSFQLDLPPEPVWVHADPVRITQVFSNLLNNAAKFSDPGGTISLHMQCECVPGGGHAIVTIRDTGIGIPPEKLARIFDLFSQLDSSLEKSTGGLGIGLSLVKRLVELHDGSVRAGSAGPGHGSEFICSLPLTMEDAVPDPGPITPSAPATSLRILIVDDNRDSADLLSIVLGHEGHETRSAYDGLDALEQITTFAPQLILLDLGMPRMNGYDVCRAARRVDGGDAISIVALTGWGQEDDRRKTSAAGFDAHFVKPVNLPELKQFIASQPFAKTDGTL